MLTIAGRCAPSVQESATQFVIRYCIEDSPFSEVHSSIAGKSVLLYGIPTAQPFVASDSATLIAILPLASPIDPAQTEASLDDGDFVLILKKVQG